MLLGTGRTRGVGYLVGLLIPIEGIQSQMNHFQKPFFSKRICGQRRKNYTEKNSTFRQHLFSKECCMHWQDLRPGQCGPLPILPLHNKGLRKDDASCRMKNERLYKREDTLRDATSVSWALLFFGLPWWLRQWRICLKCRRPRFNPWVTKIPWRRLPTPVFLLGESHGQRA